jgi:hypothetical protein
MALAALRRHLPVNLGHPCNTIAEERQQSICLFSAVKDYYSRDKLPYVAAQVTVSLAMAIGLIAIAWFYFLHLMEESWTWLFSLIIGGGLGLLKVLIQILGVTGFSNASRRQKLFIASAFGIATILVFVFCFLTVRHACKN